MKHVAAYLLAQLGGKANPSAAVTATRARARASLPRVWWGVKWGGGASG